MVYNVVNMIILISIAAFIFTILGGLFALKFKDKLHLILGFSAGAVIGVAFFDLLPESIELAGGDEKIITVVAIGFVLYLILDRFIIQHSHDNRGAIGAGSLAMHSFLDGVGIGLAFQVSNAVGLVVTTAVLVHDFSDGINTVNMILKNDGEKKKAIKWLVIDAIAPVIGIASTMLFTLSESSLGIVLALFTGFFLYIGASDLLPESHHNHPTIWTTILTIAGMVVIYIAITLAHV
jgi:ZIP family zinc transporter